MPTETETHFPKRSRMRFYNSCTSWPPEDVEAEGGLCEMVANAMSISRRTFMKHVNRDDLSVLERQLGGASHPKRGLTIAGDYHVAYYRSRLHDERVYFMTHSAIEYVFRGRG